MGNKRETGFAPNENVVLKFYRIIRPTQRTRNLLAIVLDFTPELIQILGAQIAAALFQIID